ncbi:MAG: methyltransferase domain-containing protein [Rhodospirillales bacterium]|nr:methyltransferase domain-containing protein [Rhodospirillales bacterium]MCW8862301.1 methyltransferase domain-containing protein [Rhodospirillales bacterium]MCW8952741.1 methyltransferase domain-containing protein [Rhodospirillales bacterium]MCW8970607.1 methyltransferase domain-containing protein [Rhodospirillales bacterium]MCW9038966.1 methyltransferase domain-containing protein [Rhodospirillales bacterium]
MSGWDAGQYLKFDSERLRPAVDLLTRIPLDSPATVCDLGCGAGNVTRLLAARWPAARITGIDSSPDMLERARRKGGVGINWVEADLATWRPGRPADLLYSNAALHWLPDHAILFPSLIAGLAEGGVFAVQMPRNFTAPSHSAIDSAVMEGPWVERLRPLIDNAWTGDFSFYHGLLTPLVRSLDIWETEYLHVLRGENPVLEWLKGTALRRFLDALEGEERADFEADCARRLAAAYPVRTDGETLFPFRRIFIVARK